MMNQLFGPWAMQMQSSLVTPPTVLGPAGWHGPNDIQTLQGLGGTYLWLQDPGQTTFITFSEAGGPYPIYSGTYSVSRGTTVIERGTFSAAANNPVTDISLLMLHPMGGGSRYFRVSGMLTDSNWRIYVLLLNQTAPAPGPAFVAFRVS